MTPSVRSTLADPSLRAALVAMVRRRVPPPEVDEIVQATLTEALASRNCPDDPEAIRKWVHGIARHKVVDFHRRHKHERVGSDVLESVPADSAPHDAVDLLRWAEREMPERQDNTLDWMLREGHGEKLEEIANEAELPAPQVRQRVARLRKHYRTRWAAQIAAAVALLAIAIVAVLLLRRRDDEAKKHTPPEIAPDPIAEAVELRRVALDRCAKNDWDPCLKGLDEAAKLDPVGDSAPAVKKAREDAANAKLPPPAPSPSPSPSSTPPPPIPSTKMITPTAPTSTPPTKSDWAPTKKASGKSKPSPKTGSAFE